MRTASMMTDDELRAHIARQATSAGTTAETACQPRSLAVATCSLPRALAEEILADMQDLRGEWSWRKDEPRCGNAKIYDDLSARINALDAILRGQENAEDETRRPSAPHSP